MTIQFRDFPVIILRKRIKNLNLRINRDGDVQISVPLRYPLKSIQHFLESKQDWILRHRGQILAQSTLANQHRFLGQHIPLIVHKTAQQQCIVFEDTHIACYLKEGSNQEIQQTLLQNWYRIQMKRLLPDLIKKWEPVIGVRVCHWGIKAMKTRWGSCNTLKKRIWINLYLIHEPIACLEYVLVHEMVHLLEASHNKRFYALMNQFLPGWKECRQHLKNRILQ